MSDFRTKIRATTRSSGGGAQRVLQSSDLQFLGYIRLATTYSYWESYGQTAFRQNGSTKTMYTLGDANENYPLIEHDLTGLTPNTAMSSAPYAPYVRTWTTFTHAGVGTDLQTGGGQGAYPGGLLWDDTYNGVWLTYADGYTGLGYDPPALMFTKLNDGANTVTKYGQWRGSAGAGFTRGPMTVIPSSFQSYLGGKNMLVTAPVSFGNASSPWGCTGHAWTKFNPLTTPGDAYNVSSAQSITNQRLLYHDTTYPQSRSTRYKHCYWLQPNPDNPQYWCNTYGSAIQAGTPEWGGPDKGTSSDDTISGFQWIDLDDRRGLLYFGTLCEAPAGASWTTGGTDPDNLPHQWYGAALADELPGPLQCCHGQDDPYWNATGPATNYRNAKGWIYDPNDLQAAALGTANPWTPNPTEEFEWGYINSPIPPLATRARAGVFGGSFFDPLTRRLYINCHFDDTNPGKKRFVLCVYQIN